MLHRTSLIHLGPKIKAAKHSQKPYYVVPGALSAAFAYPTCVKDR